MGAIDTDRVEEYETRRTDDGGAVGFGPRRSGWRISAEFMRYGGRPCSAAGHAGSRALLDAGRTRAPASSENRAWYLEVSEPGPTPGRGARPALIQHRSRVTKRRVCPRTSSLEGVDLAFSGRPTDRGSGSTIESESGGRACRCARGPGVVHRKPIRKDLGPRAGRSGVMVRPLADEPHDHDRGLSFDWRPSAAPGALKSTGRAGLGLGLARSARAGRTGDANTATSSSRPRVIDTTSSSTTSSSTPAESAAGGRSRGDRGPIPGRARKGLKC